MRKAAILSISLLVQLGAICVGSAQDGGVRVSFRFEEIGLRASLDSLMKWYPVSIVYLDRDIEGKSVTASCTSCRLEQALSSLLDGTSLTWIIMGNQVILKQRPVRQAVPRATVSGVVTDALTGEYIPAANALLQDSSENASVTTRRWCPTNPYGFYSLRRVSPGAYVLVISAVGYRAAKVPVLVVPDESPRRDVALTQEVITLQEVTVEGHRTALTPAEGFSSGIYIRATPSDQNQYLLDGAKIYNPSHFGGVLSTFNAEALNNVQVMVGGLPPYYGGRIGGILDFSMRDGNRERLSGSAGIGSLGAHLALEGPLAPTTVFFVSGRRGYPDVPVPFLSKHGTPSRLGSTELTAKLSHRFSGSNQVFLDGYFNRDAYNNQVDGTGSHLSNNFSWGNTTLNLWWLGIASPSVFLHASAVYTRYDLALEHSLMSADSLPSYPALSSDYGVEDLALRAHAEHYYDEQHTVRAGVELVRHQMKGGISEFSSQIARLSLQGFSSWELSIYLQDQWRILPRVMAELGARATSFSGEKGSFSAVDPRFSLLMSLDEHTRVYTSLTSINQFIHPYRSSGVFLFYPTVFWYPSNEQVKPSTSLQVTLGMQRDFGENVYSASAEFFYRITQYLHEFGTGVTDPQVQDLNAAILFGTGKNYGMELSLRKRMGDMSGSIGYVLSWARHRFPELNGGESYAPRFDRRHELQLSVSYTPDVHWTLGALCVLASEQSPSFDPMLVPDRSRYGAGMINMPEIVDINGSRLPGFQRLELKALRKFSFGGLPCQISLRVMNSYGLLDPFVWELRESRDVRFAWRARLQELQLFPLFLTVGLTVRF